MTRVWALARPVLMAQLREHGTASSGSPLAGGRVSQALNARSTDILSFWLGADFAEQSKGFYPTEKGPLWFGGGPDLDKEIKARFAADLDRANAGELDDWQGYNGLAAVILQDQFSRNIYRGTPQMYASDARAIKQAKALYEGGTLADAPPVHKSWLVLPLVHSEAAEDVVLSVQRMKELLEEAKQLQPYPEELVKKLEVNVDFMEAHKVVIDKWGRYPHRNKILGRSNTPEEEQGFANGSIPAF